MKWEASLLFKRKNEGEAATATFKPSTPSGPRVSRNSSGWKAMLEFLKEAESPVVMDIGPASPTNVNFLTSLGCSIYLPDPLHDLAMTDAGKAATTAAPEEQEAAIQQFLEESFNFSGRMFDCVLLWDTLDFLPEPLVQPIVDKLHAVMKPGGKVMSIYRSKMEPETSPHRRFHVTDSASIESQAGAGYPQLRVLQNRSVEKIFSAFHSPRLLLAADNFREAIFTR
jgi:hypothetical protein